MPSQGKLPEFNKSQKGASKKFELLSGRESEILLQLSRGSCNEDIAAALGVTIHAVEKHLSNIYRKLGITSRAEAILWWLEK